MNNSFLVVLKYKYFSYNHSNENKILNELDMFTAPIWSFIFTNIFGVVRFNPITPITPYFDAFFLFHATAGPFP